MGKLVFRAALLFALVNVLFPLHAQEASVSLSVCNPGKVDIDVFVAQSGKVSSAHIGPDDCAFVAKSVGSMRPAYVGLAFVDARGQWGAARRQDLLPDFGLGVLTRANQSVPVPHGNTTVSLPMQLLFQPRAPKCTTNLSATDKLSVFATSAERAEAARLDNITGPTKTICVDRLYSLNVVAYPDSREITFNDFCDPCEKKAQARITPTLEEEREREQERREQNPENYQRMNWNEMNLALAHLHPARGRPAEMPQYLIIRGTVSRVDVSPPGASEHWVDVYFRESSEQASSSYETSYGAFNVCASDAGIFEDTFGPDFRSRMIGQVLEVRGEYQRNYCKGWKGSIRVTLARQLRSAGSKSGKDQSPTDSGISYGDYLKALANPPRRFARFVDGCYAFYGDPAKTAWCECLSEHYRNVMTPEEESRYANDFQHLFLWEIAQPKSTDPAWQRLHPACVACAQ